MNTKNALITISMFLWAALLSGCSFAPHNTSFPLIENGMSLPEVTQLIGNPVSAESAEGETKILYYRLASSPLDTDGSDTREYFVLFKNKIVIGYGERTDEITKQRQILQYNAAWRAAGAAALGAAVATQIK